MWQSFQIILVFRLCFPEVTRGRQFSDDLARPQPRGIDIQNRVLCGPFLLFVFVINTRPVAGPGVVALAIPGRGIVDLEKELKYLAVADYLRIEHNLDSLGVRAVIAVGRVCDVAARVADPRRYDTGDFANEILHSPEASACKDRGFGRTVHAVPLEVTCIE